MRVERVRVFSHRKGNWVSPKPTLMVFGSAGIPEGILGICSTGKKIRIFMVELWKLC